MGGTYVGKIVRAFHGTPDAPLAWQKVVKEDMRALGFKECKVATGVFTHRVRDLMLVAHVDDFLASGERRFKSQGGKTATRRNSVSLDGPSERLHLESNSKETRNT